jgi:hypothetical protein
MYAGFTCMYLDLVVIMKKKLALYSMDDHENVLRSDDSMHACLFDRHPCICLCSQRRLHVGMHITLMEEIQPLASIWNPKSVVIDLNSTRACARRNDAKERADG